MAFDICICIRLDNYSHIFSHRYDHTNNARLGVIYLAQINQLPMEVLQHFQQGNWVVKGSDGRFNQVDTADSTSG